MKLAKQQRGMTFFGWMIVLSFLGVVVLFLLRVAPAYLENFSVRSSLDSLRTDGESYKTPNQVRAALANRLSVNNVANVNKEDIEIVNNGGSFGVDVNYEVRTPFMFNIDLVLSFDRHVEVPAS